MPGDGADGKIGRRVPRLWPQWLIELSMDQQVSVNDTDSVLLPFLDAEDEYSSEQLLAELISRHAEPLINRIIKNKLHVSLSLAQGSHQNQDALELAGDVCAQVLSELRRLKNDSQRRAIRDFPGYVAIKAYSACADYFREKNPQRRRLRDLLRQHLNQNPEFALWEAEYRRWLCGFRVWANPSSSNADQRPYSLSDPLSLLDDPRFTDQTVEKMAASDLLSLIFDRVGRPIDFNDLVTIAAGAWNIKDRLMESYSYDAKTSENLVEQSVSVERAVEQRLYLQRLWKEVCRLPALQQTALLLNLRDARGGNVIFFIPHLGIASKVELAEALSMSVEELAKLWAELPLEDTSIARLLGITRQQVINLRKTARERLTRRMKTIEAKTEGNKQHEFTVKTIGEPP